MARKPTGQVVDRRGKRGRTFAIRFRAYGRREYETLGAAEDGWTRSKAEEALADRLAAVRLGAWQPPRPEPDEDEAPESRTLHEFSSAWFERRRFEVGERTAEHFRWALSNHLLAPLGALDVAGIGPEQVDAFKTRKLAERERYAAASEEERKALSQPLSNGSINKALKVLAQVLDDVIGYGLHPGPNPVRGRLLKAERPRRTWLEADEAAALIEGAGDHRALIATMVLAGLRVGELIALRWRSVDLAGGKLAIEKSKTDAGRRVVDVSPWLLEELKLHRAAATYAGSDDYVFATRNGTRRERSNITRQILRPAIAAANAKRAKAGLSPITSGVTNHTARRTFASLLFEAGASPAYVMSQMGHTSSALALEVYARKMAVRRDTGERMDALVRGAEWADLGTSAHSEPEHVAA